ncbi:MAG TPA: 50S ribosomal protein L25/general stress protein Ctc [Chlamydiales bacterium]|nr:50S ribosomal protein L25/general stress protein Ctc [Chlamydiales bacterium]
MKLAIHKRTTGKKGETNKLRREGNIPAILYVQNEPGTPVYVKKDEVQAILRNMKPGLLATTVFELNEGDKKHKAIVKDIQYHVATYDVIHIDFALISDKQPVTVNVPIQMTGVADCVGVKLGGFIRQVIRTLKVSCLPKDIPQEFTVDVSKLDITHSKTLADIAIPSTVRPIAKMSEVAVIVGKKAGTA